MNTNRFREIYQQAHAAPLILAHRGDSFRAPENTLEAARLGHKTGVDGWELDVHLTRDKVPVVIHDESLARTTDVALRFAGDPRGSTGFLVRDFLWSEVRELDAGSWFVDPVGGGRTASGFGTLGRLDATAIALYASGQVRIPSLSQALEWTIARDWLVNVEIKPVVENRELVVRAVLAIIESLRTSELVAISSFDHFSVGLVTELAPALATGLLISEPLPGPAARLLAEFGADAIHASVSCCDPGFAAGEWPLLSKSSRPAVPVLVYTVNETGPSGLADRLLDAGATGWFTDDPSLFSRRGLFIPS